MPRFKQVAEILKLMDKKELIRNLGIIAHIDHGKTTLTDVLLAGAGFLSPIMAGSARVLDYLEEEQKRRITIKTSAISLVYHTPAGSFIINLVDTPGHVDFTGRVTRALRTIDGAIVVVDAVEEIMAQTEIVTRQALEERVCPVLFINKVDRLIAELKLNEQQLEEKFTRIINNFNNLIEIYSEPEFTERWKASSAKGNIVFGSALYRWGFNLSSAQRQGLRFSDIIQAYKNETLEKLQRALPLYPAIMQLVVANVPNPAEAQKYRVPKIWKGKIESEVGQAMIGCKDHGPTVVCVSNAQTEPNEGAITSGRLFSGTIRKGDQLYLVNTRVEGTVNQVSICMGAFREPVNQVSAGNLVALTGLELAKAGETLIDAGHKQGMVPFEQIKYVSEPVVTIAVEAKNPKDLPLLLEAMERLAKEDPNTTTAINKETGEYLLSGMGELHLEITMKLLKDYVGGLEIAASSPRAVYRESINEKGIIATAKSPNKQNKFTVQVEPLSEDEIKITEQNAKAKGMNRILAVDNHKNALVNNLEDTSQFQEVYDFIISGFRFASNAGPLCGEPLRHVKVTLLDVQLSENAERHNPVEVMHAVGKAIFGSFLTGRPVLLEPIYKTIISVPTELAGECSRILNRRRGKISAFEQKGGLAVIIGYIPVAETFGMSEELRTTTSGRALWQSILDRWDTLPEKLSTKAILEVRKRKGLPSEVPAASRFLEEE